jgi:hypothetical protein
LYAILKLNIAQDAEYGLGEPLHVEVIDQAHKRPVFEGTDPLFRLQLEPNKPKTFRVKSAPYPRHQVVLFDESEAKKDGGKQS